MFTKHCPSSHWILISDFLAYQKPRYTCIILGIPPSFSHKFSILLFLKMSFILMNLKIKLRIDYIKGDIALAAMLRNQFQHLKAFGFRVIL